MKKYYFSLLMLAFISCGEAKKDEKSIDSNLLSTDIVNNPKSAGGLDTVAASEMPVMTFKDTIHNFGNIKAGDVLSHDFEFTNTGKTPLIISSAAASCGCTVPDYPHEPIAPGKTGVLTVKFNSEGKSGHQEKTVNVQANTLNSTHILHIKADIN
jgi:hypothetical protein